MCNLETVIRKKSSIGMEIFICIKPFREVIYSHENMHNPGTPCMQFSCAIEVNFWSCSVLRMPFKTKSPVVVIRKGFSKEI